MEIHNLEGLLSQHPILKEVDKESINLLAGCAKNVIFQEGEIIFREGEKADLFYLLRHGRVTLEISEPSHPLFTIETLEAGEVLGWSWLFPPYKWHFDARATELTRAVALDGKCLRKKCDDNPAMGYTLVHRFANIMLKRLQATRIRLLDVYGKKGKE